MNKIVLAMLASIVLLGVLVWSMTEKPAGLQRGDGEQAGVTILCAASNRAVMDEICQDYFDEFSVRVETQYGPSQSLLSNLEVSKVGDLYLPADSSYLDKAREQGLIEESLSIARMQGVVAVKKGNPKRIRALDDLLRDDVRLVQANPEAAAIGAVTKRILTKVGKWQAVEAATRGFRTTVNDAATDIVVGAADAAIVYDAVLYSYPDLEFVEIEELSEAFSDISVGVSTSSESPQAALHFARFLTARDRGLKHYEHQGFRTVNGDKWSDAPELTVFAGSMLRPAIEDVIDSFSQREGVVVRCVFNGCGILVGEMKAGATPDAYFACDSEFMTQVADQFPAPVDVSQNELAILVKKGNPFGIRTLKDLTAPGIRVGVGHEKLCAMGWLTQQTFTESGIKSELMANVAVQSPTGDLLVNQLLAGGLDAAVAYLSNAAGMADELEALPIEGLSCSIATQPWAVREGSDFPNLADRLFQAISSAENQEIFRANGFRWQLDASSSKSADDVSE